MAKPERWRDGTWLTPPLMAVAGWGMVAGTAAALLPLFISATGTLDFMGRPLGTDFSSFWTAGRLALDGQASQAYDWRTHYAMQRATHGVDMFFPWSYPPIFLLVAAAVALLPYVPALLV